MTLDNMQASRFDRKCTISEQAALQGQKPFSLLVGRNRQKVKIASESSERLDDRLKESLTTTEIALNGERYSIKIDRYTEPGRNRQLENRMAMLCGQLRFEVVNRITGTTSAASNFAPEL